ncbi:MAG: transglutaminase domain-containing protein [Tibeticola sp.]|nr:transglutaminase domain-containing protein [Tibeticola sp.]
MTLDRRRCLRGVAAGTVSLLTPLWLRAQPTTPAAAHRPLVWAADAPWRAWTLTTTVEVRDPGRETQVWLPLPSLSTPWQQTVTHTFQTQGEAHLRADGRYGAQMLHVRFARDERRPTVTLTTTVRTRDRASPWASPVARTAPVLTAAERRFWLAPTEWLPTDGIVRKTALEAVGSARSDRARAERIYDWVVRNAWREPTTRGCGPGDIRTMLETGNLGGKCADINALFVGLCRSAGLPARDVYGVRVAPSAFGYRQLGAPSEQLSGAQHCRAEVWLEGAGWCAMDPADVTKVMRHEFPDWIRDPRDPRVEPVRQALFGGWEGNWVGWNMAHDLDLPGARGPRLPFLMYPVAEVDGERLDSYSPNDFRYRIVAARA